MTGRAALLWRIFEKNAKNFSHSIQNSTVFTVFGEIVQKLKFSGPETSIFTFLHFLKMRQGISTLPVISSYSIFLQLELLFYLYKEVTNLAGSRLNMRYRRFFSNHLKLKILLEEVTNKNIFLKNLVCYGSIQRNIFFFKF